MVRRGFLMLLPLAMSGCASRSGDDRPGIVVGAVQSILNRVLATDCRAREIPPGSTWIDYDHGGGWVQMGDDGKVHPTSAPLRSAGSTQRDKGDSPSGP